MTKRFTEGQIVGFLREADAIDNPFGATVLRMRPE
jgi:hypothetical protein